MISRLFILLGLLTISPMSAADLYLVRHAEKVADGSRDPGLTETGLQRAENLAVMLRSASIRRIFSTEFQRTRSSAQPLAALMDLTIELYDPDDLDSLAARLLVLEENALVVGHSNTTRELVDLLGGNAGPPIDEASEYDRLYLVQTDGGHVEQTILLHTPPATRY